MGGSSFGYKLAGYDVIGNVEIDPRMNEVYAANHHPKYSFNMDIRDFNRLPDSALPPELFDLDILDGSPPCTTFSMAGQREKTWGKKKKFAEGQTEQVLDTLFFDFIETAKRLKPRVVVAENVSGLLAGNAKRYAESIVYELDAAGYSAQIFHLNAAQMGVPQTRKRVFFIARRRNLNLPAIKLRVNEPPIPFGRVRTKEAGHPPSEFRKEVLAHARRNTANIADIYETHGYRPRQYNTAIVKDYEPSPTIHTKRHVRACDMSTFTNGDLIAVSTFPQDYDFGKADPSFICGMSVPPVMMAHIAAAIDEQWLSKL